MNIHQKIILSAFILIVCIMTAFILSWIIKRVGRYKTLQANRVYRLIAGSVKTILIIIGCISSLGTLGVNVSALIAGLGLTGFAFGFALKDVISNFVAGILIIIYQPFDINDRIEVMGVTGTVEDIDLRYTTIKTDADKVLIPNSALITNKIAKKR